MQASVLPPDSLPLSSRDYSRQKNNFLVVFLLRSTKSMVLALLTKSGMTCPILAGRPWPAWEVISCYGEDNVYQVR